MVTAAGLVLLEEWLDLHPESRKSLASYAWTLLERPNRPTGSAEAEHSWRVVAENYTDPEPGRMVRSILHILLANDNASFHKTSTSIALLAAATKVSPAESWRYVGEALVGHDRLSLKLSIALRGWYGDLLDLNEILNWAEINKPHGPNIVAQLASVAGNPLPDLARNLLIRYSHMNEVQGVLYANFVSGVWVGLASERYASLLHKAETWLKDSAPAVREWAEMVVHELRKEIERLRTSEDEEGLRSPV